MNRTKNRVAGRRVSAYAHECVREAMWMPDLQASFRSKRSRRLPKFLCRKCWIEQGQCLAFIGTRVVSGLTPYRTVMCRVSEPYSNSPPVVAWSMNLRLSGVPRVAGALDVRVMTESLEQPSQGTVRGIPPA